VLSVDDGRQFAEAKLKVIHRTHSPILVLDTDLGSLRTTAEHPLEMADGEVPLKRAVSDAAMRCSSGGQTSSGRQELWTADWRIKRQKF
jgi:hypothetical protein